MTSKSLMIGCVLGLASLTSLTPPTVAQLFDCNGNGIDDVCELDCGVVGGPCDVPGCGTGADCNGDGVLDDCDISPVQLAVLTADDAAAGDQFGNSVSIYGNSAIVGAWLDDDAGPATGSAYVFVRNGGVWIQQAKLTADDAAAGDEFGHSVSISGDTAIIGARLDDGVGVNSGSAYVFTRTGTVWTQQAKLTADDAAADDFFGGSVSISGDTAVIGSPFDDDACPANPLCQSGSAYVFVRSAGVWTQLAKLTGDDAAPGDTFGWSVSISSDTAVIGARFTDTTVSDTGSAYVFVRSGAVWVQQAKLTAADAAFFDEFGYSVSISGDTAVIGAYWDDDAGSNSGSAYVFVRNGFVWSQQAKFTATDAAAGDFFGFSVSISGNTAVIGSVNDDDAGNFSGSAYVFVWNGGDWIQQAKLTAGDAAGGDLFGVSVSISGDTLMIGASSNDDAGLSSGSTYVYSTVGIDCQADGIPDECQLSGNDCNADGIPDDCQLVENDCNANGIPDECDVSPTQLAKLLAADAATNDSFGYSVSISGDTAVIGSPQDRDAGPLSGSVYVFVRIGTAWTQQGKLAASDAAAGDKFGASVSISGDTAVIGSFRDSDVGPGSGSAYVFVRTGTVWAQQAKLTAADATIGDQFGFSVSISCDTAVIGSRFDDNEGIDSGSAYVFVRSGGVWSQQAKLVADDADGFDVFGSSVSISGNTAVIGAWRDDDVCPSNPNCNSGSAYVFVRTGGVWSQQAKLTAADAEASDEFGISVSISGDTAVVGSVFADTTVPGSGSVYVFVRTGTFWSPQAKLAAADAAAVDFFGNSVSISGDTAVIGSIGGDTAVPNTGSVYVFFRSGGVWAQQTKLTAADAAVDDGFGMSVSISGDTAAIGSFFDDDAGTNSGSAYLFSEFSSDCQADGVPDDCQLAGNDSNCNGIPDECEENPLDTTPPEIECEIVPITGEDSEDSDDSDDEGGGGGDEDEPAVGGAHSAPFAILFDAWDDCGEVDISAVIDIGCLLVPVENGTVVRLKCKDGCRVREKDDRLDIEAAAAILIVTAVDESGNTSDCEVVLCASADESDDGDGGDDSED